MDTWKKIILKILYLNYYSLGYLERERRDRDYTRNNDRDYHPSKNISVEESKTVILRGLPAHTTEPSVTLSPTIPKESSQYFAFI